MMDKEQKQPLDMAAIRTRLAETEGKQYWRCLEELADTDEFREFLMDEVPQQTRAIDTGMDRRRFLTLAGASLALAGLSGCRWLPERKIVPYVDNPEGMIPGIPLTYATAVLHGGFATGVLVTSREGRPIKIEGNPDHPASLGRADSITLASILNLYDPDRAQGVTRQGELSTWKEFLEAARQSLERMRPTGGVGLRILSETVTSPSLYAQIQELRRQFPQMKWHQYEVAGRSNVRAGAQAAFGEIVNTIYHFDQADRILSLDADFLLSMPNNIRHAHDFAVKRRVRTEAVSATQPQQTTMNRLYMAESTPTITGAMADHRVPMRAGDIESFARAIAHQLGVDVGSGSVAVPAGVPGEWIPALVTDLKAHPGASLVVAGDHQPPAVHVLAHAMNAALGSVGKTVTYTVPVEFEPTDHIASLKSLVDDMHGGQVQTLLILGGNPVYNAPADLSFARLLSQVPLSAHLGPHEDETSQLCKWHLPETHSLEAWGDARAFDGTATIIQPLIAPLFEGRSALETLAALTENPQPGYDLVHAYWSQQGLPGDFEKTFQTILHDGLVPNTALTARAVTLRSGAAQLASAPVVLIPGKDGDLEIIFRPDPTIGDGRYANNGWLQELPKPLTKITWDNAVYLSPATAERLRVKEEDVVELQYKGGRVSGPVSLLPGHADNSVTVHLGYGRTHAGRLGNGAGFNAYPIRTSETPDFGMGLKLVNTHGYYPLSFTRAHHSMEGRDLVMETTLDGFLKNPSFAHKDTTVNPTEAELLASNEEQESTVSKPGENSAAEQGSLYSDAAGSEHKYPADAEEASYGAYQWGMSIDNNVCIGCNACITGCQSENNIPVVGKDQVMRGREMHWIRVDRYYKGDLETPQTFFQPVTCMHCELAPCEPVCPVAATVHSHEGLNQMIYNRCVGTRYCSNNCPYKVRRFNFYKYTAGQPNNVPGNYDLPILKLVANPEVTIRGRGVMEKCSYCVQRINLKRIDAKKEGRVLGGNEVVTACQQACPTNAIVFGNILDPNSDVARLKKQPHDYSMLADLNTRPRTTYLAKFRNPNPDIPSDVASKPDSKAEE
jgi:MoCo/4Fe-4S cofactor protein with predicted Tat translocation signal